MSSANVEIVLRCDEAWSRWDPGEIAGFYSDDAEIVSATTDLTGKTYHGHGGLRQYMADFGEAFERPEMETLEVIPAGDQVAVVTRVSTRGRASGAAVMTESTAVFTLRDGLICREVVYPTRAEALEAMGNP
jgi:ketosteroid isomerase-like protein